MISGVLIALTSFAGISTTLSNNRPIQDAVVSNPTPLLLYFAWMGAVLGLGGSVITLLLQNYRPRWFWSCLIIASILWMTLLPLGTIIGFFALVVLLANRSKFPGVGHEKTPV